ncbi:histidine triad nucleotide-binding protein [bacterium]|nr:histidine triad nucleotide-binding protein [bacterium]
MSTVFKKIIDKEIPAKILYEDEHCLAFHDLDAQAPSHVLLIPKKEIKSFNEVKAEDKELLGHMMTKVPEIARLLGIAQDGFRVVCNTGSNGGQSVFHIHFHILGGRALAWPPG